MNGVTASVGIFKLILNTKRRQHEFGDGDKPRARYAVAFDKSDGALSRAFQTAFAAAYDGKECALLPINSADFKQTLFEVQLADAVVANKAEDTQLRARTRQGVWAPYRNSVAAAFGARQEGPETTLQTFTQADRVALVAACLDELPLRLRVPAAGLASEHDSDAVPLGDLIATGRVKAFPLHDQQWLDWLHTNWVSAVGSATLAQPLHAVSAYFGEHVGFYFSWLQLYATALIANAALGLGMFVYERWNGYSSGATILYALVSALWATITLKMWKRRQSTLALQWGVLGLEESERLRPQHRGRRVKAAPGAEAGATSTGDVTAMGSPAQRTEQVAEKPALQLLRFACVTIPVMCVCLGIAVVYMCACERLRQIVEGVMAFPLPMPRPDAQLSGLHKGSHHPHGTLRLDIADDYSWLYASSLSVAHNATYRSGFGALDEALSTLDFTLAGAALAVSRWLLDGAVVTTELAASPDATVAAVLPWYWGLLMAQLPTVLFLLGITVSDQVNGKVARWLSDFENHPTDTSYEQSLIAKRALLQFTYNFVSLFYIAFVRQDLARLRETLMFLLGWKAVINNVQETVLPLLRGEAKLIASKVAGQTQHRRVSTHDLNAIAITAALQAGREAEASAAPDSAPPAAGAGEGGGVSGAQSLTEAAGLKPGDAAGESESGASSEPVALEQAHRRIAAYPEGPEGLRRRQIGAADVELQASGLSRGVASAVTHVRAAGVRDEEPIQAGGPPAASPRPSGGSPRLSMPCDASRGGVQEKAQGVSRDYTFPIHTAAPASPASGDYDSALPRLHLATSGAAGANAASCATAPAPQKRDRVNSMLDAATNLQEHLNAAQVECSLEPYDPFDDMLEMFVQFGHVTLFTAVFPLAPLLALANNLIEVHSDAFKIVNLQRPRPRKVASLGAWNFALEVVTFIGVCSNAALVYVAWSQGQPSAGAELRLATLLWCVLLEHALIALKILLDRRLPDVPDAVRITQTMHNRARAALAVL
jgi:hypothetical protein